MAEELTAAPGSPEVSEPEIRRRRGVSPIWAVPIVAALVAAWLGYTAYMERGPSITISFRTAAGIEAGKTRIKHHDIELGVIDHIEPSADLTHVIVSARMNKTAAQHLRDGTIFWVVRPRFSLGGISGIETLISGAYIEMDAGEGAPKHSFEGLEQPPAVRADVPGREFILTTQKLGSIGVGSPLLFRGIDVGQVTAYTFAGVQEGLTVQIFVRKPYDDLVSGNTRFWNAAGISLSTGASGFKVDIESLQAVLAGGIAFDTPEESQQPEASKEGTTFPLYDDRDQARDASYTRVSRIIAEFDGSVHGLDIGAPVEFRGMKIGKVVDFRLEFNPATQTFHIPVTLAVEFERVRLTSGNYDQYGHGTLIAELVKRGLRAQLRSASLITGQLMVFFDFFPDAPPATVVMTEGYPRVPTVPNELENITNSVSATLDRIAALPLDGLVSDVRKILASTLALTDAPELRESMRTLNKTMAGAEKTMAEAERLLHDVGTQVAPLAASLRRASDAADAALVQLDTTLASVNTGYGRDSKIRTDLSDLFRQLQETAKSIRVLASYLEQHPEALVRGKTTETQ